MAALLARRRVERPRRVPIMMMQLDRIGSDRSVAVTGGFACWGDNTQPQERYCMTALHDKHYMYPHVHVSRLIPVGPIICVQSCNRQISKSAHFGAPELVAPLRRSNVGASQPLQGAQKRGPGALPLSRAPWPHPRPRHAPTAPQPRPLLAARNKHCDFPLCNVGKEDDEGGEAEVATPSQISMPPPPPRSSQPSTGGSSFAPRAPSPAPSNASSTSTTASTVRGRAQTKIFCKDCYDASNTRPMNFHAPCWNAWHGLCAECE